MQHQIGYSTLARLGFCIAADVLGAMLSAGLSRFEIRQEAWLNDMLRITGRGGHPVRVLFDQLVVDINPDCGPLWLDRVLGREGRGEDWARLSTALEALAECAGVRLAAAKCA